MTDSNSGNNCAAPPSGSNCITAGQPGQVLTINGSNAPQWVTIPINATGAAGGNGCAGTWVVPGQTYTITVGGGGAGGGGSSQISFGDIEWAVPVEEKEEVSDGCFCKKCKEYYQYAEPNQDDGTLICYGCRMSW